MDSLTRDRITPFKGMLKGAQKVLVIQLQLRETRLGSNNPDVFACEGNCGMPPYSHQYI